MVKNDEILMPEYICDVLIHPLKQLGIKPVFFSINNKFKPNWNDINKKINKKSKALLMVHYFGQPQNIREYKEFSLSNNLYLIEDNAHGHGGTYNGKTLGTFGNIGISSPRKTIDLFSGGILYLNDKLNDNFTLTNSYPISPIKIFRNNISKILNSSGFNLIKMKFLIKKILSERPKYEDPKAFYEEFINDYKIDNYSKLIINKTNWIKERSLRQKNYYIWQEFCLNHNLEPVYDSINSESNPWCYPAYAKNNEDAIKWYKWGWDKGKFIFSWPTLPKEILIKESESLERWKKLICFSTKDF